VGAAFAVRAYRWYWSSQLVSGIGTWAQAVAQSWLVLKLTGSAFALGAVATLQFLPMLVFPLLGGVVADRIPRRRLLLATQIGALAQAVLLGVLVWTGTVQYWEVGVLALLLGLTNAFGNPAQQALVPELVGRDLVGNAVALNSVQFNLARLLGGAIGGLAVATLGIAATLFLNAASYLPAIVVLAVIRPAHAAAVVSVGTRVLGDIGDGLRYALGTPSIRRVLALFAVVGLLGFNWTVAVPLLAVSLGAGPAGFGAMMSALGIGSLVAGLILMRGHDATERVLALAGIGLGGALVLLGLSSWYGVSLALLVVAGLVGITATVTANTRLQLLTPDAYRGRVMSLFVMLMGGTTPIGALLLGAIAQAWGIRVGLFIFGSLTIVSLLAIVALNRSVNREPAGAASGVVDIEAVATASAGPAAGD
jgi:MFS family permease